MRYLGMIGTTFRRAGQDDLTRYSCADPEAMRALHAACDFEESVYVNTCNRVEVMFVGRPGVSVAQYRERLYQHFHPPTGDAQVLQEGRRQAARLFHGYEGEGAAERLFVVSASLDAMNPGDAQVLGQVKDALKAAQQAGLAGPTLATVFEEAFAAAKKVRHLTKLGEGNVSVVSLLRHLIEARLQGPQPKLVVIGAGDMAHQCGLTFGRRPELTLVFANRTLARAQELAQQYGGEALALEAFVAAPGRLDVLVTATAAPTRLFGAAFFARVQAPLPHIFDLAVQRDVDVDAAATAGAKVFDLDAIRHIAEHNRRERQSEMGAARAVVDEALESYRRKVVEREMGPVVRVLRDAYEKAMNEELGTLMKVLEKNAAAPQAETLHLWARSLVNRLAHVPTVGLKQLAFTHGVDAVEAFLEGVQRQGRQSKKRDEP